MRLPRVRFTMRRIMVAVAMSAAYSLIERHRLLYGIPAAWKPEEYSRYKHRLDRNASLAFRRVEHHFEMMFKYRDAGRRPWLPVAPDPPEPK
jgi:hypothetical protein